MYGGEEERSVWWGGGKECMVERRKRGEVYRTMIKGNTSRKKARMCGGKKYTV